MSEQYNHYILEHCSNVSKAYDWLYNKIPEVMKDKSFDIYLLIEKHDASKWSDDEYDAYDKYFYGGNKSHKVVKNFNYAWLHHIHKNPHHWQYWVLKHDDEPEEALEMPLEYVIEMICDWWSFSFKTGNLYEIFDWYEKHKDMKLNDNTRKLVESILNAIKEKLDEENKND